MRKKIIFLLCGLAVIISISGYLIVGYDGILIPEYTEWDAEAEKYAVYSAVIEQDYLAPGKSYAHFLQSIFPWIGEEKKAYPSLITIQEDTLLWIECHGSIELDISLTYMKKLGFITLNKSTWKQFKRQCYDSFEPFEMKLNVRLPYIIFKKGERAVEDAGGWEKFYRKYPGSCGLISFSKPAFNHKRTQALLYVQISCEGLCGRVYFALLDKQNGKWIITKIGIVMLM